MSDMAAAHERPSSDAFVSVREGAPVAADTPVQPIRPAPSVAEAWPRAQPERRAVARAGVNREGNSRLGLALPAGGGATWRIRWARDVSGGMLPDWVLTAGARVLVQGAGRWELLDHAGQRIRLGGFGAHAMALDPGRGLFYAPGAAGEIIARRLADGEQAFYFALTLGRRYARSYLARSGERFVALSVEQMLSPHAPVPPDSAMVEAVDLSPDPVVEPFDLSASAPVTARLYHQSRALAGAMRGRAVVLATRDHLTYADTELRIRRQFSADFSPVALSLDEAGRAYLLVDTGGRRALWVVTPDGERIGTVVLPDDAQRAAHPPIVGYDHTVYVLGASRVHAHAPDGSPRWLSEPGPTPAGAAVTADDHLLAAVGSRVVAFDPVGTPATLFELPDGEQLRTAPVLTERGELLVASRERLYCLSAG